ncbi:HIT domain-containing protein [Amycolatopsis nigrescens]|uniref:HIT domain-containing protein n=1 Tax=Amycolatopsis nigrescens TaxID=381445 RepID=UPI001FE11EE9|nr:HIT domain-containing protein [Amycolatopsis nigrescens]
MPKRHSKDLFEIPAEDLAAVTLAAQRIAKAAAAEFGADGVNLLNCCGAAAWQTVFHFHLHVIPRYLARPRIGWCCPGNRESPAMWTRSPDWAVGSAPHRTPGHDRVVVT